MKYVPKNDISEVEIIWQKLTLSCKTNAILAIMFEYEMMVLQHVDSRGEWWDIDDKDEVKDKNKI